MACALGYQELVNLNPFLKDLDDQGYLGDFAGGYFILYGLPYLDKDGSLAHGDIASPLDLDDKGIIGRPGSHQVWFRGGKPHDQAKRELGIGIAESKVEVTKDFVTNYAFSCKLLDKNKEKRDYETLEEKIHTYLELIVAPAMAAFPHATPLRAIEKKAAEQGSPLRFPDTSSARYHLNDISSLLRDKAVAIIGLGGTGSYILDFIARTHLARIALFDDDTVHIHTIFRMPGFVDRAIGKGKVDALAEHYGNWHSAIEPVKERITQENVERLQAFDFVFVSVDDGPTRAFVVEWLSAKAIPYVDCGMGLNRVVGGLNGTVRITGADRSAFDRTINTAYLPTAKGKEDEYRKQAQIAELNALNAALAVVRFKQYFKLYERLDEAGWYTFETAPFALEAEGRSE